LHKVPVSNPNMTLASMKLFTLYIVAYKITNPRHLTILNP